MAVKTRSTIKSDITNTLETGGLNRISEIRDVTEDIVDSAVFPADLATVATTGSYNDLSDTPAGGGSVDDTAFGAGWDAETEVAPSQNAVYDKITAMDTTISGKAEDSVTITAGDGLTGGGDLSDDRTVSLDAASIASLALADSAIQSADLATVATTGSFSDLSDSPVSTSAYGVGWSGSGDVPTQGTLYTKIEALDAAKADSSHTHTKSDITDFNEADYAEDVHTHTKSDITDFSEGDYATPSDIELFVNSDITGIVGATQVVNIVIVPLGGIPETPDANTLYFELEE